MPTFDPTGVAHLDSGNSTKPIFLIYLDVLGDPIRATTAGYPVVLPTLSDPDLSGLTFYPTVQVLTVGDITYHEDGSDTLQVDLSGQLLPDADLLAAIGDTTKWQTRAARIWVILRDETRTQQGAIADFYTGYMSAVALIPRPTSQVVRLQIEGHRALLSQASNRSYLDQARYDAADTSARATVGSSNGANTGPGGGIGGAGGAGIDTRDSIPRLQEFSPLP